MSIYYSRFLLNTYQSPYFKAHIPKDYPLHLTLQKSRAFRRLPPHLQELSKLSKKWVHRAYPDRIANDPINNWYDDKGYELDPNDKHHLTDEEIDAQWDRYPKSAELEKFNVIDIPIPKGGFDDPYTWEPKPEEEGPSEDHDGPTEERVVSDVASHGLERTAKEYGVLDKITNSTTDKELARLVLDNRGKNSRTTNTALSIEAGLGGGIVASLEAMVDHLPEKINVTGLGKLRAVVVGRLDNDVLPARYPSFNPSDSNEVDDPSAAGKTKRDYNPTMFDRAIEQTEALCALLEKEGVQVFRPPLVPLEVAQADPVGLGSEWAREIFTVFGNRLVVNQPRTPHRNKDHTALDPFFMALAQAGKSTIHSLPPCSLDINNDWINDPRPFLEGGDIFRLGADVIVTMSYLASSPTGFRWLVDLLEPDGITVWPAYITGDFEHGDYVFYTPREGLCVAYLDGFVDGLLPSPCLDWDCVALTRDEANERFAANGLVLRENVLLMTEGCPRVVRALEKKGVEVIQIPFDGPQYWQGGIRCATSELWRE